MLSCRFNLKQNFKLPTKLKGASWQEYRLLNKAHVTVYKQVNRDGSIVLEKKVVILTLNFTFYLVSDFRFHAHNKRRNVVLKIFQATSQTNLLLCSLL